ncbi:MAG: hypothetical protein EXR73_04975 [Myxococcales bacterium]|nr:hypothetical protein [Myxococcales bacterium]
MELERPLALLLALPLALVLWLARRAAQGTARPHPLWFLLDDGPGAGPTGPTRFPRGLALRLLALAALALAAAGPARRTARHAVVIDLSLHADPTVPSEADLVIAARPGAPPVQARTGERFVTGAGVTTDAELVAAFALAVAGGATHVDLVSRRPPAGAHNRGLLGATLLRDPLRARTATLVIELARTADAPAAELLLHDGDTLLARRRLPDDVTGRFSLLLPYEGDGSRTLAVTLAPHDALPDDDTGAIGIPPLGPVPIVIASDVAPEVVRALALLPTVTLGPAGIGVVHVGTPASRATDPTTRAELVFAPAPTVAAPLLAVPGAPLPGLPPALLDDATAPAVLAPDDAEVWLWAGARPAVARAGDVVYATDVGTGAVLPVLLADLFAAAPLAPRDHCRVDRGGPSPPGTIHGDDLCAHVFAAADAALLAPLAAHAPRTLRRPARPDRSPTHALVALALALLVVEAALARPRGVALALRAVALVATAAALVPARAAPRPVVLLVDHSDSVGATGETAARDFAATLPAGTPLDYLPFAGTTPPTPASRGATDLTAAARAGAARLASPGRVVFVTDGADTDARSATALLVPLAAGHDLAAVRVRPPPAPRLFARPAPAARAGIPFALALSADLPHAATARITVAHAGKPVAARTLPLPAGVSEFTVELSLPDAGEALLELTLVTADTTDYPTGNATAHALAAVALVGPPHTLTVDAATAPSLTTDPAALAAWDRILLDDLPYAALGDARVHALAKWVRAGGTLVATGGPHAFGPGGWTGTPLDDLLPLRSDPRPLDTDRTALLLVIDRSGSMDAPASPASPASPAPLDAHRLGALARRLAPTDLLAIIGFDSTAQLIRPLVPAGDTLALPGLPVAAGATDPVPALALALELLHEAPVGTRRLVALISDGDFPEREADALTAAVRLAATGARLVAIPAPHTGAAGRARLAALAHAGAGVLLDDATLLPALVAAPPGDRPLFVVTTNNADDATSHDAALAPFGGPFRAHTRTALAPGARLHASLDGDPLLASHGLGLGRAFAFAAALAEPSSPPGTAPSLLVLTATHAAAACLPALSTPAAPAHDGRLVVTVECDAPPRSLRHIDPAGSAHQIPFIATGTTRHEATLDVRAPGLHRIAVDAARAAWLQPEPESRHDVAAEEAFFTLAARLAAAPPAAPRPPFHAPFALALAVAALLLASTIRFRASTGQPHARPDLPPPPPRPHDAPR